MRWLFISVVLCIALSVAVAASVPADADTDAKSSATATTTLPARQSTAIVPSIATPSVVGAKSSATITSLPAQQKPPARAPISENTIPVFATSSPTADAPASAKHLTAWDVINKLLQLILVLMVMYFALLLLKKSQQGQLRLPFSRNALFAPPSRQLLVLETITLGQGRAVHLVAVGNRRLLLGTTNQQVVLLTEVTDAVPDTATPADAPAITAPTNPAFESYFTQAAANYAPVPEERGGRR